MSRPREPFPAFRTPPLKAVRESIGRAASMQTPVGTALPVRMSSGGFAVYLLRNIDMVNGITFRKIAMIFIHMRPLLPKRGIVPVVENTLP